MKHQVLAPAAVENLEDWKFMNNWCEDLAKLSDGEFDIRVSLRFKKFKQEQCLVPVFDMQTLAKSAAEHAIFAAPLEDAAADDSEEEHAPLAGPAGPSPEPVTPGPKKAPVAVNPTAEFQTPPKKARLLTAGSLPAMPPSAPLIAV